MKEMRIAHKLVHILFHDRIQYPGKLFTEMVVVATRFGVLMLLYAYVFHLNDGLIRSMTFSTAMWSIFLYFVLFIMGMRTITRAIINDVRSGAIEMYFSRPVSYVWFRAWWQIGQGLYPCIVIGSLGAIVLWVTVGVPATMMLWIFIPSLIVTFLGGILLIVGLYTVIGLLAFWIEDADPVYWIIDKAIMMLGGAYIPVALMPSYIQTFAVYSPFGSTYLITHTPYTTWAHDFAWLLGIQWMWIIVVGLTAMWLFSRAQRRVSINGG